MFVWLCVHEEVCIWVMPDDNSCSLDLFLISKYTFVWCLTLLRDGFSASFDTFSKKNQGPKPRERASECLDLLIFLSFLFTMECGLGDAADLSRHS